MPPPAFVLAALLAALPPLLYVYIPRPPVSGSQFIVYPAMAGILGVVTAVLVRERPIASRAVVGWLLVLLLYSVVAGLSFVVNASELRGSAPAELFRPVSYGVFIAYGYVVGRNFGGHAMNRGLLWAGLVILMGQALLAATQIFDFPVFGLIYNAEKSHPFGALMRITGSLGNPNAFAWIVAQSAVIVSLMHPSRLRGVWIALATLLVLLSGSRTLLLLFPFMIVTAQVLRDPTNLRTYARYVSFALLVLAVFTGVIVFLGEYFPYLAQLKNIAASGSFASVNSFALRLEIWAGGYEEFREGGLMALLIGLGARESTAIMDNDFLYVLFRFGLLGALVHFTIIAGAFGEFLRARSNLVAVFGAEYVIFALVFGTVSETTASWHLPLVMFALLGLVLGSEELRRARGEGSARQVLLRSRVQDAEFGPSGLRAKKAVRV